MRQQEVAKIFRVGQSAVTKWKTGKDTPSLPRAILMAKEHGVCVEWLLTGRGPKHPTGTADAELARVLELWDNLSQAARHEVADFAAFKRGTLSSHLADRHKEVKAHESNSGTPSLRLDSKLRTARLR